MDGAINCYGLGVELLAEAFHGIVFGLVQEDCRFSAASFMVWMYCELSESPVFAYLWRQRYATFASERAERTCHVDYLGGGKI